MPDGDVFIVRYNALDQWRAIIDHTQFSSAIYDAHGDRIGHFDGLGNTDETNWEEMAEFGAKMIKPFLEVDTDATYVTLDLMNLLGDV